MSESRRRMLLDQVREADAVAVLHAAAHVLDDEAWRVKADAWWPDPHSKVCTHCREHGVWWEADTERFYNMARTHRCGDPASDGVARRYEVSGCREHVSAAEDARGREAYGDRDWEEHQAEEVWERERDARDAALAAKRAQPIEGRCNARAGHGGFCHSNRAKGLVDAADGVTPRCTHHGRRSA